MARIRMAYIGGGSTRGAGTMASFVQQGENFAGSEIVLIDLDPERLELSRRLSERMAEARGLDLKITATTDRRAGLTDCDAVLSSYRPGGFEARVLDERIPLSTASSARRRRDLAASSWRCARSTRCRAILDDTRRVCPNARDLQLHEPGQHRRPGGDDHSDVPFVSLCEGPIVLPPTVARAAGLDPDGLRYRDASASTTLAGACEHTYQGPDAMPLVAEAWERRKDDPSSPAHCAGSCGSRPSWARSRPTTSSTTTSSDEMLAELQAKPTTRAEDILGVGRTTGSTTASRPERRPAARPEALARRHPRARARHRRDGRHLQRRRTRSCRSTSRTPAARCRASTRLVVEMLGALRRAGRWIQPLPHAARSRSTCAGSCTSWASTRRSPPRRPGRARAAMRSARSPRTR